MNLSINGQSQVPPGFRFHPTEEELLHYYLRKKVGYEKIDLDVIREVDLNKLEPWDIQEKCKIGSTPQNDWYFFSHKDKKYPTGTRTNRATAAGFWKATGRDKIIYSGFRRIGLRKTLVFYKGRAPHGQKSDWIMHEYRLDDTTITTTTTTNVSSNIGSDSGNEEGWVVCRVFRKKNYQKTLDSPCRALSSAASNIMDSSKNQILDQARNDGVLDQILVYMGRSCKMENQQSYNNNNTRFLSNMSDQERFLHLPRLESPTTTTTTSNLLPASIYDDGFDMEIPTDHQLMQSDGHDHDHYTKTEQVNDWVTLDRLVASQLNCGGGVSGGDQVEMVSSSKQLYFPLSPLDDHDDHIDHHHHHMIKLPNQGIANTHHHCDHQSYGGGDDNDLWSFTTKLSSTSPSSSSDPLCHLSV